MTSGHLGAGTFWVMKSRMISKGTSEALIISARRKRWREFEVSSRRARRHPREIGDTSVDHAPDALVACVMFISPLTGPSMPPRRITYLLILGELAKRCLHVVHVGSEEVARRYSAVEESFETTKDREDYQSRQRPTEGQTQDTKERACRAGYHAAANRNHLIVSVSEGADAALMMGMARDHLGSAF
jgi:hypothetical protein